MSDRVFRIITVLIVLISSDITFYFTGRAEVLRERIADFAEIRAAIHDRCLPPDMPGRLIMHDDMPVVIR